MFLKGTSRKTILSKMVQPALQRAFSRNSVMAYLNAKEATMEAEYAKDIEPNFNGDQWQPLQQ